MKQNLIKILIFEKSYLIRQGLVTLTENLARCELIDEYQDASQFLIAVKLNKPQIIFLNVELLETIPEKSFSQSKKEHKFILLGIIQGKNSARKEQFDDYINICDNKEGLIKKLNLQIDSIIQEKGKKKPDNHLSERERDIITLVAKGMTNKEIASRLFLSIHTVITHRKNISRKLGIKSVSGLTVYAIINKFIEMKDIH